MKDLIPKGTGDSRTLKSNISANTTFTEFLSMLRSGTLPIDIGAINAGGVQQMGTPLNKENLLTDETAGKFNFSPSENPNINDVFCFLAQKMHGSYAYVWKKTKYTESLGESVAGKRLYGSTTFFSDSIIIDQSNGNVSMATQEKLTFNYGTVEEANAALSGKYIEPTSSGSNWKGIHKIESVTGIGSGKVTVTTKKVTSYYNVQTITTEDKNTYYEGYVDQSGWTYFEFFEETHDKIGFVETGYYVGTGESGELSPNSLTFDFVPKLIFLFDSGGRPHIQYDFDRYDSTPIYGLCSSLTTKFEKDKLFNSPHYLSDYRGSIFAKKSEDGKTISWYIEGKGVGGEAQHNKAGVIYLYFALG